MTLMELMAVAPSWDRQKGVGRHLLPCRVLPVVAMADASDVSLSKPIAILEQTRPPRLAPAARARPNIQLMAPLLADARLLTPTSCCRWQVATRKVKQLIVLVDKMEQAQSALETKLRGTEVRQPSPHGTPPALCPPQRSRTFPCWRGRRSSRRATHST